MAKNTMFRRIEMKIDEKENPGDKPEAGFSLKNVSGDSWSLAKIVGIGDGSFGGRLAFETNAGGKKPTDETIERLAIDHNGHVGIGGSLTIGGKLTAGTIAGGTVTGDLGVDGKLEVKGTLNATDIRMKGKPLALSPWSDATGGIIYKSGNVGIGTTTPESPLHVFTPGAEGAHLMLGGRKITLKGVNEPEKWQHRLPHIEWREGDDTRAMYIGYGDTEKKHISMRLENGYKLIIDGGLLEIEQENWKPMTPFANGWKNYSGTYNPAGYFKDSMCIVHLRGLVKDGATSKHIFILPAGCRPQHREIHAVFTRTTPNVHGRVDIKTNGEILPWPGDKGWTSLDGITFRAAG